MKREPRTERQFREALAEQGYELIEKEGQFHLRKIKGWASTRLVAETEPDALAEAWELVRD